MRAVFDGGPPPPCPCPFNLTAHTLGGAPDAPALIVDSGKGVRRWSFAALETAIRATAGTLHAAGLRAGDRLALRIGNHPAFPFAFFAAAGLGALPVPLSAQLTPRELSAILDDLDTAWLAWDGALPLPDRPGLRPLDVSDPAGPLWEGGWAETAPDDPAYIVYTSGTGGRAKGVLHAHRAAWARRMMWEAWYGLRPNDRMLHAGAFNWTYTLGTGLTDPWAAGATAIVYTGPPAPGIWADLIRRHGATLFAAAPGVYRQWLAVGPLGAMPTLRHGLSAGEALPEPLRAAFTAATGRPIAQALGMSEVSTYISERPDRPHSPGTAGRPQPGRRVAILSPDGDPDGGPDGDPDGDPDGTCPYDSPGDLAVDRRDPGLMLGYWRRPDETAAALRGDWFLTGDRAAMAPDGTITYHGRSDEVMNAQGFRVAPQDVEAALLTIPGVADCAVAPVAVRPDVEVIAAFVVAPDLDEASLATAAEARLARYKCPRVWVKLAALPRGPTGKLIRRALPPLWKGPEP